MPFANCGVCLTRSSKGLHALAMQSNDRRTRQLSLDELLPTGPRWKELPSDTRARVLELVGQMLQEHVDSLAEGEADE